MGRWYGMGCRRDGGVSGGADADAGTDEVPPRHSSLSLSLDVRSLKLSSRRGSACTSGSGLVAWEGAVKDGWSTEWRG